jgi:hypothetical protein
MNGKPIALWPVEFRALVKARYPVVGFGLTIAAMRLWV